MRAAVTSGITLIAATYGLARFGYGLFLPQFTETFEMGALAAGIISASSFVSYCLSAVIASRIGDHPRRMVMCAGGAASVGSLGVAGAPDLSVFATSVLIAGAGGVRLSRSRGPDPAQPRASSSGERADHRQLRHGGGHRRRGRPDVPHSRALAVGLADHRRGGAPGHGGHPPCR